MTEETKPEAIKNKCETEGCEAIAVALATRTTDKVKMETAKLCAHHAVTWLEGDEYFTRLEPNPDLADGSAP